MVREAFQYESEHAVVIQWAIERDEFGTHRVAVAIDGGTRLHKMYKRAIRKGVEMKAWRPTALVGAPFVNTRDYAHPITREQYDTFLQDTGWIYRDARWYTDIELGDRSDELIAAGSVGALD